jgi:predicted dehydrogenase
MKIDCGWWLPSWRPHSDYREQYSARKDLGGGIVMDAIHEIDYALALAGPAVGVASRLSRSGLLEIDVEDIADISLRHAAGAQSAIHLDYLRRRYSRSCTVISERGEATWDFAAGRLEVCDDPGSAGRLLEFEDRVDTNAAYVAEMRHFLDCITDRTPSVNGFQEAATTTETALRALEVNAG